MIRAFSDIASWRLRLALLIAFLVPALTGWPFLLFQDRMTVITAWTMYGCVLNLLILREAQFDGWATMFSAACIISIFTGLTGALLTFVSLLFQPSITKIGQGELGFRYLQQIILMLSTIPFTFFAVKCFPVSELIRKLAKYGRFAFKDRFFILAIRILNQITEVVEGFVLLWREEMPDLISPRLPRCLSRTNPLYLVLFVGRAYSGIEAACRALLLQSMYPLPVFVHEVSALEEITNK